MIDQLLVNHMAGYFFRRGWRWCHLLCCLRSSWHTQHDALLSCVLILLVLSHPREIRRIQCVHKEGNVEIRQVLFYILSLFCPIYMHSRLVRFWCAGDWCAVVVVIDHSVQSAILLVTNYSVNLSISRSMVRNSPQDQQQNSSWNEMKSLWNWSIG